MAASSASSSSSGGAGHAKGTASFGGGAGAGGGGASSFGDWYAQYSAQQQRMEEGDDVEMGLLGGVDRFFRDRVGLGPVQDQAAALVGRVVAGVRGEDGIVAGAKSTVDATLNYGARLRASLALLALGALFYLLGFFVALPVILLRPAKFAICATMGSLLCLGSVSALVGPWAHLQSLLKRERLPFTVAYLGTLVLTLYASLVARSYLLVVFSTALQLGAFVWYLLAFLPGGPQGLRLLGAAICRAGSTAASGCTRALGWCLSG